MRPTTSRPEPRCRVRFAARAAPWAPTSALASAAAIGLGAAMLLGGVAGCSKKRQETQAEPPPPDVIVPTPPEPEPGPRPRPAWAKQLPEGEVTLAAGTRVWATPPTGATEMAEVGVYTLESSQGATATLVDKMGRKTTGVPAAVIHPLNTRHQPSLREGEVVLCFSWTTRGILGRVAKVSAGKVLVQYDWAGVTKSGRMDHVEPAIRKVAPLAFVEFPKAGRTSRGFLIALSDTHGWLRTGSGHIEVHERAGLKALNVSGKPLGVGQPVRAYSWVGGFEQGTISKVLERGLRYVVAFTDDRPEQTHFFDSLVPAD